MSVLKEVLGEDPRNVPGVFLFEFDYTPFSEGFNPFRIEAQAVIVEGEEFLWCDGVDFDDPVLLPMRSARGLRFLGEMNTLADCYAEQIGQLAMTEDLSLASPTLLLRAARCMAEDGLGSADAFSSAATLSQMILELDELDRRYLDGAVQLTLDAVSMYATA